MAVVPVARRRSGRAAGAGAGRGRIVVPLPPGPLGSPFGGVPERARRRPEYSPSEETVFCTVLAYLADKSMSDCVAAPSEPGRRGSALEAEYGRHVAEANAFLMEMAKARAATPAEIQKALEWTPGQLQAAGQGGRVVSSGGVDFDVTDGVRIDVLPHVNRYLAKTYGTRYKAEIEIDAEDHLDTHHVRFRVIDGSTHIAGAFVGDVDPHTEAGRYDEGLGEKGVLREMDDDIVEDIGGLPWRQGLDHILFNMPRAF